MFKKLHITCNQATTICDKSQYGEASFFEKIQLKWHLLICKVCASYSEQNNLMTQLFHVKKTDCKGKQVCLSESDKETLKKKLETHKSN